MIPHRLEIEGYPSSEQFFLVEKPGLDVAIIAGVEEDVPRDEESDCYAPTTVPVAVL